MASGVQWCPLHELANLIQTRLDQGSRPQTQTETHKWWLASLAIGSYMLLRASVCLGYHCILHLHALQQLAAESSPDAHACRDYACKPCFLGALPGLKPDHATCTSQIIVVHMCAWSMHRQLTCYKEGTLHSICSCRDVFLVKIISCP